MGINKLQLLKKTRRKPLAGDIFVFQVNTLPDRFYFGRVINTNTNIGGVDGGVTLIYLYSTYSDEKDSVPKLKTDNLLLPPVAINHMPWSKGFFEYVDNVGFLQGDILPVDCFHSIARGCYLDEFGKRLDRAYEPVGVYGVSGLGEIEERIVSALGLP